jgi:hypothetical protein
MRTSISGGAWTDVAGASAQYRLPLASAGERQGDVRAGGRDSTVRLEQAGSLARLGVDDGLGIDL